MFAAHVNYVGYGPGPFANLLHSGPGDALYVKMDNGFVYTYTVQSVKVVPLAQLNMDEVVYVDLPEDKERVTLISCGGTFIPNPNGPGGDYTSRVILVAERYLD
jgi:sortase (surface protein transpeptidase)